MTAIVYGFRRRYGAGPLHLIGHLLFLGVAAFALNRIFSGGHVVQLLVWYLGFALAQDLILIPTYSLLDRGLRTLVARGSRARSGSAGVEAGPVGPAPVPESGQAPDAGQVSAPGEGATSAPGPGAGQVSAPGEGATPAPGPGVLNHLRFPALISGVLLLVYAPVIFGKSNDTLRFYGGHPAEGYLRNWVLVTLALFLISAAVYGIRALRTRGRRL